MQILNRVDSIPLQKVKTELEEQTLIRRISQGDRTAFWQLWEQYQEYLYSRCLTWMAGNQADASEALSRAALKAWDKMPTYAPKITNPKAWLTRLTHNLCMDIHRERSRGAMGIESIEQMQAGENELLSSTLASPEAAVLCQELSMSIRCAINALPMKLRVPFILRYEQEMSYQDIAQQLALSHDNVRKRVQQARGILQKQLHKYLSGVDDSAWEESKSEQPATFDFAAPTAMETALEQINYKVIATCLELLPHAWYRSLSPLGWR